MRFSRTRVISTEALASSTPLASCSMEHVTVTGPLHSWLRWKGAYAEAPSSRAPTKVAPDPLQTRFCSAGACASGSTVSRSERLELHRTSAWGWSGGHTLMRSRSAVTGEREEMRSVGAAIVSRIGNGVMVAEGVMEEVEVPEGVTVGVPV